MSAGMAAAVAARAAKRRRQRTTLVWISCDGSRCAPLQERVRRLGQVVVGQAAGGECLELEAVVVAVVLLLVAVAVLQIPVLVTQPA